MDQHIELILFNVDSQNEKDMVSKTQSIGDPRRASMASSVAAANGAAVA